MLPYQKGHRYLAGDGEMYIQMDSKKQQWKDLTMISQESNACFSLLSCVIISQIINQC